MCDRTRAREACGVSVGGVLHRGGAVLGLARIGVYAAEHDVAVGDEGQHGDVEADGLVDAVVGESRM